MARITPNLSKRKAQSKSQLKNIGQPLKTGLMHYVGFFTVGYIIASAVFMMIQTKIALNPQLVTVLSIVVGAYIAVYKFVKHQQRSLSSSEINRLTVGSTGAVWLLTVIYFLAIWLWLFDAANREVLLEMSMQQPMPLVSALLIILLLTLISARLSIWALNSLLNPKRKQS